MFIIIFLNRKITRLFLLLTWLLTTVFFVSAEQLPVRKYTAADGLGSSFVDDLMRDSRGFLWFCTRDGLSRFDGQRFTTYQVGGKDAPPGVEQIIETRTGTFLIATTGGIYRFNPQNVSVPAAVGVKRTLDAELISEKRGTLYQDRAGNLWLAADGLYLLATDDGTLVFRKVDMELPANPKVAFSINGIAEGRDGSFWLCTSWGLVRRLPDARLTFYSVEEPLTDSLFAVLAADDGRIWLTRASGVYVIQPEESNANDASIEARRLDALTQIQTSPPNDVYLPVQPGAIFKFFVGIGFTKNLIRNPYQSLYQSTDKHIWVTAVQSLIEFDGQRFRSYTAAQGLSAFMIKAAEDAAGNLWLVGPNGVMRLDRKGLTGFSRTDGLSGDPVVSLQQTDTGELYAVSGAGVISLFDGKTFVQIRLPVAADAKTVWHSNAAFLDRTGAWWALTSDKLYRFAPARDFAALARQPPVAVYDNFNGATQTFYRIFEDARGTLWISTSGAKKNLLCWTPADEQLKRFTASDGFSDDDAVSAFAEDKRGQIWLGFRSGNLARFADGRLTTFTTKDGLPDGLMTAMYVDQQNRLWLASSHGGVIRIDDVAADRPHFTHYTTENGLASNNARTLTADEFGQIYIGTVRGVDRLTPATGIVKHYSVNDGLAGDFVYAAMREKSGALWFGTANGVSRLLPEAENQTSPPPVWLSGLRVAGVGQSVNELGSSDISDLEFSSSQNNLQIDYFVIDFNPNESLRYQYKLEGADWDWNAPTEQRTVNYANLQSGSYRFMVRALNEEGATSPKPATISFTILPPVWRRWWFITLAAFVGAAVVFLIARSRFNRLMERRRAEEELRKAKEERLRELERVRRRIATDLHDDIGSSLTQIAILSEVARQQIGTHDAPLVSPLTQITNVSNELVEAMSDIVWAINPRKDYLSDLAQRMRRLASDVLTARSITIHFDAPDMEQNIHMGANVRREIFLIFKESLNNIVTHAGCTEVNIELRITRDYLTLQICDNGKGFDVAIASQSITSKRGGNGVRNIRKRAQELNGELDITSGIGHGTTVMLRVPLTRQDN